MADLEEGLRAYDTETLVEELRARGCPLVEKWDALVAAVKAANNEDGIGSDDAPVYLEADAATGWAQGYGSGQQSILRHFQLLPVHTEHQQLKTQALEALKAFLARTPTKAMRIAYIGDRRSALFAAADRLLAFETKHPEVL